MLTLFATGELTAGPPIIDHADLLERARTTVVQVIGSEQRADMIGAGVVVSSDGYVLTANHLVRDADLIAVRTTSGRALSAELVVSEPAFDIALLKVDSPIPMVPATFASQSRARAGTKAVVVANPLGNGQKMLAGRVGGARLVSWNGRSAQLQAILAPLELGSSGGGTFDRNTGELLGINIARSSGQPSVGFMVTVDRLWEILRHQQPVEDVVRTEEIAEHLGARLHPARLLEGKQERGLLVTSVRVGSPADQAGWKTGDFLAGVSHLDHDAIRQLLLPVTTAATIGDRLPGNHIHDLVLVNRASALAPTAIGIR